MDMNSSLYCTEAINISDYNDLSDRTEDSRPPATAQRNTSQRRSNNTTTAADRIQKALHDPTFLQNRCLDNLLLAEEQFNASNDRPFAYLQRASSDITPAIRKMAVDWLFEVCDDQKCQEEVPLIAVNYMDRILNQRRSVIKKTHLQLLASACLLIASKLREPSCRALPVGLLVYYTDYSISKKDLINWEVLVLSQLNWNVATITPLDFLELLLARLPIENNATRCADISLEKIRKHAQTFIGLATREHDFICYTASNVAASSIAAALNGLKWHLRSGMDIGHLFNLLTDLTGVEQEYLIQCTLKMEELFQEQRRRHLAYLPHFDDCEDLPMTISDVKTLLTAKTTSNSSTTTRTSSKTSSTPAVPHNNKTTSKSVKVCKSNTPTDILEVEI